MKFGVFDGFSLGAKLPTGANEEGRDSKAVFSTIMFD